MGLFNFNLGNSTTATSGSTPEIIQLALNEEIVTVTAAEAKGLTIEQLFNRFASALGDTARISRYICAGRIVEGTSTPEVGMIYRGAVSSESKG
jgi:hypothetical protein